MPIMNNSAKAMIGLHGLGSVAHSLLDSSEYAFFHQQKVHNKCPSLCYKWGGCICSCIKALRKLSKMTQGLIDCYNTACVWNIKMGKELTSTLARSLLCKKIIPRECQPKLWNGKNCSLQFSMPNHSDKPSLLSPDDRCWSVIGHRWAQLYSGKRVSAPRKRQRRKLSQNIKGMSHWCILNIILMDATNTVRHISANVASVWCLWGSCAHFGPVAGRYPSLL